MLKKIEVSFACDSTTREAQSEHSNASLDSIFASLQEMGKNDNTKFVKFTISAENRKSLPKSTAGQLISKLITGNDSSIKGICRVQGDNEDGPDIVDFINNDYLFTMQYECVSRYFIVKEVFDSMYKHFKTNLNQIMKSLGYI
jgi:hypothetical protein